MQRLKFTLRVDRSDRKRPADGIVDASDDRFVTRTRIVDIFGPEGHAVVRSHIPDITKIGIESCRDGVVGRHVRATWKLAVIVEAIERGSKRQLTRRRGAMIG